MRRDTGAKNPIPIATLGQDIERLLNEIQSDLYNRALKEYEARLKIVREWKDFVPALNNRNICVIPWCDVEACEDEIKDRSAKE